MNLVLSNSYVNSFESIAIMRKMVQTFVTHISTVAAKLLNKCVQQFPDNTVLMTSKRDFSLTAEA